MTSLAPSLRWLLGQFLELALLLVLLGVFADGAGSANGWWKPVLVCTGTSILSTVGAFLLPLGPLAAFAGVALFVFGENRWGSLLLVVGPIFSVVGIEELLQLTATACGVAS